MNTIRAIVRYSKIEFLEPAEVSECTEVLVMVPSTADNKFWMAVNERSLEGIWNNAEDDVYEQLLKV